MLPECACSTTACVFYSIVYSTAPSAVLEQSVLHRPVQILSVSVLQQLLLPLVVYGLLQLLLPLNYVLQ